MEKGAWDIGLLLKKAKLLIHVGIMEKRYVLFLGLEYPDMLILVNITDMWYIYIDGYLLKHIEIVDGLLFSLGGLYNVSIIF